MEKHYFNPIAGYIYMTKDGTKYICIESDGHFRSNFQRSDSWTFTAHGCQMNEDGSIEWDGSTGGYFAE